jgi:CRP-like cAMP-binding protein
MSLAASTLSAQRVPLLRIDPELAELLPAERRPAAARCLKVPVFRLARRDFELGRLEASSARNLGLLIVDGIVAREVTLGDIVSAELLGSGDLVRPWDLAGGDALLESTARWIALSDFVQVALLDRRFAAELAVFPEINLAFVDRLNSRATRLASSQAISQLKRVDRRLLALFTHLADRWGRMTGDGVMVPVRLPHSMLARLVGARRPTVSSALARLAETGELVRRPDGFWLVHGHVAVAA